VLGTPAHVVYGTLHDAIFDPQFQTQISPKLFIHSIMSQNTMQHSRSLSPSKRRDASPSKINESFFFYLFFFIRIGHITNAILGKSRFEQGYHSDVYITPGPGAYNPPATELGGPKFTIRRKLEKSSSTNALNPGPGSYELKPAFGNGPKISFPKSKS
jgi:hypothetical protein